MKPFGVESYPEEIFGHELLTYNYFHIGQEPYQEVREMEYSYFGNVRQEGREEGLQGMPLIVLEMLQVKPSKDYQFSRRETKWDRSALS